MPSQFHPTTVAMPAPFAAATPRSAVSGADEHDARRGVAEDVLGLLRGEVVVDRHRRGTGEQAAEVGQCGLGGVLGIDGDAMVRAEFTGTIRSDQSARAAVQCLVDLGPREFAGAIGGDVDECETGRIFGRSLFREARHQGPIGRPLAGRSKAAWR